MSDNNIIKVLKRKWIMRDCFKDLKNIDDDIIDSKFEDMWKILNWNDSFDLLKLDFDCSSSDDAKLTETY